MEIEYVQYYENEKMGIKTEDGEVVVPAIYSFVAPFSDGCFQVINDGKHGFVNLKGEEFIPLTDEVECYCDFSEGLASFRKDGKWGFIDKKGKIAIPPTFQYCENFHEGLAKVAIKDSKFGYVDKKGKIVIDCRFVQAEEFSNGYAVVCVDDAERYGIIDKKGKVVVEPEFAYISPVEEDGTAVVQKLDDTGYHEGTLKIGVGVEWNDNLDHLNEFNRVAGELSKGFTKLINAMYESGCACEYPRVRQIVQWKSEDRFFDAELLFGAMREHLDKVEEIPDPTGEFSGIWEYTCPNCKSRYRETWKQLSVDFDLTCVEILDLKIKKDKGSKALKSGKGKIPVVLGFAGFGDIVGKYDEEYSYSEMEDLIEFLQK